MKVYFGLRVNSLSIFLPSYLKDKNKGLSGSKDATTTLNSKADKLSHQQKETFAEVRELTY